MQLWLKAQPEVLLRRCKINLRGFKGFPGIMTNQNVCGSICFFRPLKLMMKLTSIILTVLKTNILIKHFIGWIHCCRLFVHLLSTVCYVTLSLHCSPQWLFQQMDACLSSFVFSHPHTDSWISQQRHEKLCVFLLWWCCMWVIIKLNCFGGQREYFVFKCFIS